METVDRLVILAELTRRDRNIGKTALMKFLYFLQTVFKVPLGYDYSIYTYGPFSQTVMSDIEVADCLGYLCISSIYYPNGMSGYQLTISPNGESLIQNHNDIVSKYSGPIENIIKTLSSKNARDLELLSTIVYVQNSFIENGWDTSTDEICCTVKQIKPHFSQETIQAAYYDLISYNYISSRSN